MTRHVAVFLALALAGCASRTAPSTPPAAPTAKAKAAEVAPRPTIAVDDAECRTVRADADAVRLFEKGCDGGDARGCFDLSIRYLCGVGVARDAKKGAEAAERSCDLGVMQACGNAGMLYLR